MMRRVVFDGSRWHCNCPALGPCSHAIATARVVVAPGAWIAAPDVLASVGPAPLDDRERRLAGTSDPPERGRRRGESEGVTAMRCTVCANEQVNKVDVLLATDFFPPCRAKRASRFPFPPMRAAGRFPPER